VPRDDAWVTIATFPTTFEASLARGALEAIGIAAFVPGEELGTFSRYRGGLAFSELQVFASDRERALSELHRMQIRLAKRSSD
jgi:hypothetical protein